MTTQISIPVEGTHALKMTHRTAVLTRTKAAGRMFFVDNLRVFLTVLVVLHHLAITYGAGGSWSYLERPTTDLTETLLSILTTLDHFFFMGVFFLVSGYFVPASLERKGTWHFIKDRMVRLGIPLLIFGFLVSPLTSYISDLSRGEMDKSFPQFYAWSLRNLEFNSGPLWFVEVLLVFSVVFALGLAALKWLQSRRGTGEQATNPSQQRLLTTRMILIFALLLAPASFITRLFFPLDTAIHNLQFSMFPQYILLFAAGILAYRWSWLPDLPARVSRVWSIAAILCILALPVMMVLTGAIEDDAPFKGGLTAQSMLLSTWEALYCPAMAILLLALFRRRFDHQGSLGRFFSKNAYTAYIIHAPIIVCLAWVLRDVSIYPLLKYVLVAPLAIGLCFVFSHFAVRRIPLSEKVL
jgi:surface polysaccharide O-acyltransferase-like enzyme